METRQWWDQPALTVSNCCSSHWHKLPLPAGTPVLGKQHGDLEPRRDSGGPTHSWHPEEHEKDVSATIKPSR